MIVIKSVLCHQHAQGTEEKSHRCKEQAGITAEMRGTSHID